MNGGIPLLAVALKSEIGDRLAEGVLVEKGAYLRLVVGGQQLQGVVIGLLGEKPALVAHTASRGLRRRSGWARHRRAPGSGGGRRCRCRRRRGAPGRCRRARDSHLRRACLRPAGRRIGHAEEPLRLRMTVIRRPPVPADGGLLVLLHAAPEVVLRGEIELRRREVLVRGLAPPLGGLQVVLLDAVTVFVGIAQVELRRRIALVRGETEPLCRSLHALVDA